MTGVVTTVRYFLFHRAVAAFFAISERFLAVSLIALAGPPISPPRRPRAAAAALTSAGISGFSVLSAIVSMIRTAARVSSSRFLERLGITGVQVRN